MHWCCSTPNLESAEFTLFVRRRSPVCGPRHGLRPGATRGEARSEQGSRGTVPRPKMEPSMTPTLANAYLRLMWGRNRLRELVTSHHDICAANARTIVPNSDIRTALAPGDARSVAFVDTTKFMPVPESVSQLVSETALHFRGALDYMVGQLSILDTPNVSGQRRRTQFPIEDLESQFDGQRSRYLIGVNDDHVASLKAIQPFNGCSWTRLLRDLSNQDKHNDLILTRLM